MKVIYGNLRMTFVAASRSKLHQMMHAVLYEDIGDKDVCDKLNDD